MKKRLLDVEMGMLPEKTKLSLVTPVIAFMVTAAWARQMLAAKSNRILGSIMIVYYKKTIKIWAKNTISSIKKRGLSWEEIFTAF